MRINLQSKGDNGDSRYLPNVTASRGRCKPGTSSRFSKITPELRHQKCRGCRQSKIRRGSRVKGHHMRSNTENQLQVCCNRWLKREKWLSSFYRTGACFISRALRFDFIFRPERKRVRNGHILALGQTERKNRHVQESIYGYEFRLQRKRS